MRAGAHEIPVQQDGAGGIPPALGVENCSGSPRAPRLPSPDMGSRGNFHDSIGRHSPVLAKAQYELRQDFAYQARVGLTARQRDTLDFIRHVIDEFGKAPTITEIADGIGAQAKSQVFYLLRALVERGYIRRHPNKSRGIEIIPLVGPSLNGEPLIFIPVHNGGNSRA